MVEERVQFPLGALERVREDVPDALGPETWMGPLPNVRSLTIWFGHAAIV